MNPKRVVLAGVAAFVVVFGITFALNAGTGLFTWMYAGSQVTMRPEAERLARLPYVMIAVLFSRIVFAYLYARYYAHDQGIVGAVKLGLILALLVILPERISEWVQYPVGAALPLGLIPYQFFEWILSGLIVGLVYKPEQVVRHEAIAV